MARRLTIRDVPEALRRRLEELSRTKGQSVNATVLELLSEALGINERRTRLERYMTWTSQDLEEFEAPLKSQRTVDEDLWK